MMWISCSATKKKRKSRKIRKKRNKKLPKKERWELLRKVFVSLLDNKEEDRNESFKLGEKNVGGDCCNFPYCLESWRVADCLLSTTSVVKLADSRSGFLFCIFMATGQEFCSVPENIQ